MSIPVEIKANPNIPVLAPGYTVKVHVKVVEGDRVRTQLFQGVVIKTRLGATGNFTVRRVAYGVGVERTFPNSSPLVEKVEIVRVGKVRRARLFYLRGLSGKAARLREKRFELIGEAAGPEAEAEAEATPEAAAPEAAAATAEAPAGQAEAQAPKAEAPAAEAAPATPPASEPAAEAPKAESQEAAKPQ